MVRTFSSCVGESGGSLIGQTVNQIDIDAVEPERAGGGDQVARHLVGLHAMDGLLHERIEILHAHAQAIETETAKSFEMRGGGDARVDFDADFGVGRKGEALARESRKDRPSARE